MSSSASSSFKGVVNTLISSLMPNVSDNVVREIVVKNMPPEFIDDFNRKMENPEYRAQVDIAVKNVKDYYDKLLSAIQDPFNKAIDNIADNVIPKLVGSLSKSATTAVFNIATAIPGVGAVLSAGKLMNNLTETAQNFTGSISNATSVIQEAAQSAKDKLSELKQENIQVNNRVSNSIQQFERPLQFSMQPAPITNATQSGGRKKRSMTKRKRRKSKRYYR